MKFLIFAVSLTLLLNFPESEAELKEKQFVIGIENVSSMEYMLPDDHWLYLYPKHKEININNCTRLLNSVWIFPESYSNTSKKPFGMINEQYKAYDIGKLTLYYDESTVTIHVFCCKHDENMAIYIAYNTKLDDYIAFRKTSNSGMTLGIHYGVPYSYEDAVTSVINSFHSNFIIKKFKDVVIPTVYCLSFFWRLSRYEMEDYEAHTIISEISPNKLECKSSLFSEVDNGYRLYCDIILHTDLATGQNTLFLKNNDEVDLTTVYLK